MLALWGGGAVLADIGTQYLANKYYGVDPTADITLESAGDALAIGIGVDGIINFDRVLNNPSADTYDKLYAGGWAALDAVPLLDVARNINYVPFDDVLGVVPKQFQNSIKLSDEVVENVSVKPYEVGLANELRGRSIVGDQIDIHHIGQSHLYNQTHCCPTKIRTKRN